MMSINSGRYISPTFIKLTLVKPIVNCALSNSLNTYVAQTSQFVAYMMSINSGRYISPTFIKLTLVKPIVNCALSNSLNTYNRHSDWHKLEVYATKMHKLEVYATKETQTGSMYYKDVHLFMGFTIRNNNRLRPYRAWNTAKLTPMGIRSTWGKSAEIRRNTLSIRRNTQAKTPQAKTPTGV